VLHGIGGLASHHLLSILGSCRRRGIEPSAYLAEVLRRLPSMMADQVKNLVPARWKSAVPDP